MRINKKNVWKQAEPTLNCFWNVSWCSLSEICFCFCLFYALLCCTRMNTINKSLISLPLNLFNFQALSSHSSSFSSIFGTWWNFGFHPFQGTSLGPHHDLLVCEKRNPCCKSLVGRFRIKLELQSFCQEILSVGLAVVNNSKWILMD